MWRDPALLQWESLRLKLGGDYSNSGDPEFALRYDDAALGVVVMRGNVDLQTLCQSRSTYRGARVNVSF